MIGNIYNDGNNRIKAATAKEKIYARKLQKQ